VRHRALKHDAPEEQEGQAPVTAAAEEGFSALAQTVSLLQGSGGSSIAIAAGADIAWLHSWLNHQ